MQRFEILCRKCGAKLEVLGTESVTDGLWYRVGPCDKCAPSSKAEKPAQPDPSIGTAWGDRESYSLTRYPGIAAFVEQRVGERTRGMCIRSDKLRGVAAALIAMADDEDKLAGKEAPPKRDDEACGIGGSERPGGRCAWAPAPKESDPTTNDCTITGLTDPIQMLERVKPIMKFHDVLGWENLINNVAGLANLCKSVIAKFRPIGFDGIHQATVQGHVCYEWETKFFQVTGRKVHPGTRSA